ncbi:MAG TPA: outer membrane beta-barrel protein, partial [Thermoanaerobaculia bacterium]|nr:outer membrane beta-barrel protein [Thermoanaerobaculia bacterium]
RNSGEVHETAMPLGGRNAAWLPILSLMWGLASTAIGQARDSAGSPASSPAASSDTPPTERERMLLERIERLEHRLSEIEASGATAPAARAAAPPASQVSAASAPASASALSSVSSPPASAQTDAVAQVETPAAEKSEPFAFADFSWLTGNSRQKESPLAGKVVSGEFRVDTAYTYSFNHPQDNTIGGSTEVFRHNELQLTELGFGGDLNWKNVRARLLTQFGMYSQTQPRNDASPGRGQYNLDSAYRYLGEAYGGYHIDALNGINVDGGIFLSYIGLFSFYQFDNWAYQPSYVSSNTPWYFNGIRIQIYPSDKLKIEPWIINGWQSYGKFNKAPGVGGQVLWRPTGSLSIVSNNYWGTDTLGTPDRKRIHTDDSVQVKYYDQPGQFLNKLAATLTVDLGCEYGGGVSCTGGSANSPAQYFAGFMVYNRFWFHDDVYAVTVGGGEINNPGRYLVLLPPINGATAFSGTPYFPESPGYPFKAWDYSVTFDYMPRDFVTFRLEFNRRMASVPYFSGPGGVTPLGGNTGPPGSFVPGFTPDLVRGESRVTTAILVKY